MASTKNCRRSLRLQAGKVQKLNARKKNKLALQQFLSNPPPGLEHLVAGVAMFIEEASRLRRQKKDLEKIVERQEIALHQAEVADSMRKAEDQRRQIAKERAAESLAKAGRPLPGLWHSNPLAETAQEAHTQNCHRQPREFPKIFSRLGISVAKSKKRGDMS